MKNVLKKISLACILTVPLCNGLFGNRIAAYRISAVESILTEHQWTLKDIIQNSGDTATDITLFMLPCEKDNLLIFNSSGTYQILEGASKCNIADDDTKGHGEWKYDPQDTSILERYEGGKRLAKKIIYIDDNSLKIKYQGEGKKVFVLTYSSEKGIAAEQNDELTIDNSEAAKTVTNNIKDYLVSEGHYTVIDKKKFKSDQPLSSIEKNKQQPVVAIFPFRKTIIDINSEETKQFIEHAKKTGIDFIISGSIKEAVIMSDNKNGFKADVQYQITIININANQPNSEEFIHHDIKDSSTGKKESVWDRIKITAGKAGKVLGHIPGFIYARLGMYDNLYRTLFITSVVSAASNKTSEMSNIFTQVDDQRRKRNYDSAMALTKAISKTAEDMQNFIAKTAPAKQKNSEIKTTATESNKAITTDTNIYLQEYAILKTVGMVQPKPYKASIEMESLNQEN